MKIIFAFLLFTVSAFAQFPYVQSPTNTAVDGYLIQRTGSKNKWVTPGSVVTNVNGPWIEKNSGTGTNITISTNLTLRFGTVVTSETNVVHKFSTLGSPFTIYSYPATYNSTRDDAFKFGYNLSPAGAYNLNEPVAFFGIEANYNNGSSNVMEFNLEFNDTNSIIRRLFGGQVDRTNNFPTVTLTADYFEIDGTIATNSSSLISTFTLTKNGQMNLNGRTNASPRFNINSFGTSLTPIFALQCAGSPKWYYFCDGGGDVGLHIQNNAGTECLFIDQSTARVGIGTITPSARLSVAGTVTAPTITLTNNPTFQTTNAAPAGFVVGTTVPATWFVITNGVGARFLVPGYTP